MNLFGIDICVLLLWCDSGEVFLFDGFLRYDFSGFLVGDVFLDLDFLVCFVEICVGEGFLGVILEEFFWDVFYEDCLLMFCGFVFFFGGVVGGVFFIIFFGMIINFVVDCGGMICYGLWLNEMYELLYKNYGIFLIFML